MANLALLLLSFGLGVLARRSGALPEDSHRAVNAWVLFVSLPALVFRSLHRATVEPSLLASSALLWLVFAVPAAVAFVAWRRGAPAGTTGAVALCAGLGNTAFVGLPLVEAVAGREALAFAAVVDQLGSFLALFLFAMPFAALLSGAAGAARRSLRKSLTSPATWALVLAFALREVELPAVGAVVINRLADMLSPLALASIGWQLDLSALRGRGRALVLGLAWKLLVAPAMVAGVLWLARGGLDLASRVVVLQAAMAPMVTAGVVASEHDLEPRLAAALIAVGVPLSLVTVPAWWALTAP
jgi:predicted permease